MKAKQFEPKYIFYATTILIGIISVIFATNTNGVAILNVISANGKDRFMDFFNHIEYVREPQNTYFVTSHACFPPFAYIIYYFFSLLLPEGSIKNFNINVSSQALLLYVVYISVSTLLFVYAMKPYIAHLKNSEQLLIICSVLLSNVFIFGVFERGNSTLLVLITLLCALSFKDSESRVKREIAMLLIAFAAGMKLYPAVFGLIYLKEKRWKEAGRLIIYGLIVCFLPFVFFGGTEALKQFFNNQFLVHDSTGGNIGASLKMFVKMLAGGAEQAETTGLIVTIASAVVLLVSFFLLPLEKYQQYLILCVAMIAIPFWSGYYTLCYMVIPFLCMLSRKPNNVPTKKGNSIFSSIMFFIFAVIFSFSLLPSMFGDYTYAKNYNTVVFFESGTVYFMTLAVITFGIICLIRNKQIKNR